MKKFFFSLMVCLFALTQVHAQRTVSGKVTDDTGETLPGVNVVIKGTTTGTTTDLDGNYRLQVNDGDILIYSFVGFEAQEINAGTRSVIDVTMGGATELQEVVVVGYGESTTKKLTGSIDKVDAKKFEQVPLPSFDNILQGNVAGLNVQGTSGMPGGATNVRLRGIGSINAGSAPLYVLDGVPINVGDLSRDQQTANALASLNPNDIENVTVLKDASAAAIYGSRAANGVIIITTKKGKPGQTKFTLRVQQGVSERRDDPFDVMNSAQFTEYMREAVVNAGGNPDDAGSASTYYPIAPDTVDTPWLDLAFQDGSLKSYELSASGGDDKTRFFISGSFLDQEGIAVQTQLERFTSRFNIDHSATEKLTFGVNLTIANAKQNGRYGAGTSFGDPIYGGMYLSPLYRIYATQEQIDNGEDRGTGFNFNTPGFSNHNHVATQALSSNVANTFRTTGKVYLNYDLLEGLTFNQSVGLDMVRINEDSWTSQNHPDGVNDGGFVTAVSTFNRDYVITSTLNYNTSFNDVHNITVLAGNEFQSANRESIDVTANNFPSDKLRTINSGAENFGYGAFGTEWSIWGIFSRVNYNFDERYFVDVSVRRDGSSRFGANNRFATFYSVGAGWNIVDESFFNVSFVDQLKLRGSWGTSGNQSIDNFASRGLYQFGSYDGQSVSFPSQLDNPDLTWEQSQQVDIGIDYSLFQGRLNGSIDYYNKETTDMLLEVPISRTTGFEELDQNLGTMVNKGWEFTLSSVNLQMGDFSWATDFNISVNDNEITSLPEGADIPDGNNIQRVGESVNSWYMPVYAGVNPANGAPLWYDEDGNVVTAYGQADRQIVGNPVANVLSGLTNTFQYKGLSLSAFLFLSHGNDVYRSVSRFINSDGSRFGRNQSTEQLRRWQQPGDITDVPIIKQGNTDGGNNASTRQIHDGSFLRLRNVTVAYNLPANMASKMKLTSVRIYAQGQNVKTWTKYPGLDPEVGIDGVDFGLYPQPRSYTVGIDIGF
ncbi:SusC/RagA family TonB-linked outer membrane protein [Ekhidna lutea]|nr:TonB-dependent receptor [Ekhidna lutea]